MSTSIETFHTENDDLQAEMPPRGEFTTALEKYQNDLRAPTETIPGDSQPEVRGWPKELFNEYTSRHDEQAEALRTLIARDEHARRWDGLEKYDKQYDEAENR